MALTVGVATVLEAREVVVVVTGQRKSLALSKAIGELYFQPRLLENAIRPLSSLVYAHPFIIRSLYFISL